MSPARDTYDAIVIGSGFGGGVSACRMAEAGMRVCVLERGRRFAPEDFEDGVEHLPDMLWHPTLNPGGIFEVRMFRRGVLLCASGVGGGSLVYANVQLRADQRTFSRGWPDGTDRASLDRYYDRTEEALDPRPVPDEYALAKVSAIDALGRSVGREAQRTPLAVHFGDDRVNPFGGVAQGGCTNLGRCMTGCPRHAKNTVDITYLARAERLGAVVRPLYEVLELAPPRGGSRNRWTVTYRDLESGDSGRVRAPTVVVSAGTLGTNRLLLRNRSKLPRLSDALGTRFSGNGDALGAIFEPSVNGSVELTTGPTITSYLDYWQDRGIFIEDGGISNGLLGLIEAVQGVSVLEGAGRGLLGLRAASTRVGVTDHLVTPAMARVKRNGKHPTNAFAFLFMGRDSSNGSFRLNGLDQIEIEIDPDDSRLLFDRMQDTMDELGAAAGGEPTFTTGPGPFGRFLIGHPLGGCAMSDSPASGVVDSFGRVYGYEHDGLRILDGSIVPTAIGVNPSKTIAALAERGVEHLIEEGR